MKKGDKVRILENSDRGYYNKIGKLYSYYDQNSNFVWVELEDELGDDVLDYPKTLFNKSDVILEEYFLLKRNIELI